MHRTPVQRLLHAGQTVYRTGFLSLTLNSERLKWIQKGSDGANWGDGLEHVGCSDPVRGTFQSATLARDPTSDEAADTKIACKISSITAHSVSNRSLAVHAAGGAQ